MNDTAMKRTCVLSSAHPTHDIRIFHKECTSLVEHGYQVTLVAPGEKDEVSNGVTIKVVPKQDKRLLRMTKTVWEVYRKALGEDANIYHLHEPELLPIGALLKLRGKKIIYDAHEDYPSDILSKDWIPKRLRKPVATLLAAIEKIAANWFDGVILAGPIQRFEEDITTIVVRNYPLLETVHGTDINYRKRDNNIVYFGWLTVPRGVKEMILAMDILPETLNAKLVFGGKFDSASLEKEAHALPGWRRVQFLGWLEKAQMEAVLKEARVGLVLLHPSVYASALPTKLLEYMASGIPIVASKNAQWSHIVDDSECGVLVDSYSPSEIANAIQRLLSNPKLAEEMGDNGRSAVENNCNWGHEAEKLIGLYDRLL